MCMKYFRHVVHRNDIGHFKSNIVIANRFDSDILADVMVYIQKTSSKETDFIVSVILNFKRPFQ